MKKEMNIIHCTLQRCFDVGTDDTFLSQIISMFRRKWRGQTLVLSFIDDMEVRFISSFRTYR
ncbi:hypothetical protein B9T62_05150 [Paenibacillus donghaensis]|uniref:Uncharacterized protein n=1 Tax=Paenibacillus donghaensis TaxID=414771 RepID=A0A2Z2KB85_9BACL|nr:hypothetical protein B9T62_05150 [Paenibacillus donghaensis]